MRYATVGVEFIAIFLAMLFAGLWADRRVGTRVLFTLIGMSVGFAGGIYRLVSVIRHYRPGDESVSLDDDERNAT